MAKKPNGEKKQPIQSGKTNPTNRESPLNRKLFPLTAWFLIIAASFESNFMLPDQMLSRSVNPSAVSCYTQKQCFCLGPRQVTPEHLLAAEMDRQVSIWSSLSEKRLTLFKKGQQRWTHNTFTRDTSPFLLNGTIHLQQQWHLAVAFQKDIVLHHYVLLSVCQLVLCVCFTCVVIFTPAPPL